MYKKSAGLLEPFPMTYSKQIPKDASSSQLKDIFAGKKEKVGRHGSRSGIFTACAVFLIETP